MILDTATLPTVNATLNGASALLLAAGWVAIRRRNVAVHRALMLTAFAVSCAFLTSYLYYHSQVGSVPFTGTGWVRPLYFTILISHIILAAAIVPLALVTLLRAWRAQYDRHRRIARVTLPLWMYVSITGVIVYLMLYG